MEEETASGDEMWDDGNEDEERRRGRGSGSCWNSWNVVCRESLKKSLSSARAAVVSAEPEAAI